MPVSASNRSFVGLPKEFRDKVDAKRKQRKPLVERISHLKKQCTKYPDDDKYSTELKAKEAARHAIDNEISQLFDQATASAVRDAEDAGQDIDVALQQAQAARAKQKKESCFCSGYA